MIPESIAFFFAGLRTAIALGAAKYMFKIGIAMIDTIFIYWAKRAYGQRHPAEA